MGNVVLLERMMRISAAEFRIEGENFSTEWSSVIRRPNVIGFQKWAFSDTKVGRKDLWLCLKLFIMCSSEVLWFISSSGTFPPTNISFDVIATQKSIGENELSVHHISQTLCLYYKVKRNHLPQREITFWLFQ